MLTPSLIAILGVVFVVGLTLINFLYHNLFTDCRPRKAFRLAVIDMLEAVLVLVIFSIAAVGIYNLSLHAVLHLIER